MRLHPARAVGLLRAPWIPGWSKDPLWRRARAVPSLDLRFADNKSLVDATTGANLVTFSRASRGTYVDSQGVIRNATTNLLLRSEEFDNASWSKGGLLAFGSGSTANAITAPTGTVTADLLTEDTSTGQHRVWQTASNTVNTNAHTVSFYAKAKERTRIYVGIAESPSFSRQGNATFNLGNGTVISFATGNNGATGGTASIVDAGNGWYRCSYSLVLGGTNTSVFTDINIISTGSTISYTGDGTSGIYIWGAQLEQSSTVGEYIPTTSTINSAPRFDHNPTTGESLGLLMEEARTNSIRNNTMVGAVAGTPGTLPTNWIRFLGGTAATQVVGTGTESGITYIDVRFTGVASDACSFFIDGNGGNASANGQTWTGSAYFSLAAGSFSGVTVAFANYEADSGGAALAATSVSLHTLITDASLQSQRTSVTRTNSNASTALQQLVLVITGTGSFDLTLRIGLPQLEQGAFATSVIPTSGTAATRAADVCSISGSNFSSWYNATQGSVFIEAQTATVNAGFITFRDASAAEYIRMGREFNGLSGLVSKASGITAALYSGQTLNLNAPFKGALGYAVNDFALTQNGGSPIVDTSGALPDPANELTLGQGRYLAPYINGPIRRLTYWPQRLPNATLQAITL